MSNARGQHSAGGQFGLTRRRVPAWWTALVALVAVWFTCVACGVDTQTLQPYTPAMGVNADVGPSAVVKVRNLVLVSRVPGQAFVSASLISERPDALIEVAGASVLADGSEGAPLQATLANPVELRPGNLVVLTDRPLIVVRSPDVRAGTTAKVLLRFREAGEVTLLTPIYRNQGEYETVQPRFPPPSVTA